MQCPKCGAVSTSITECSACGIIFERFEHAHDIQVKHQREEQLRELTGETGSWVELGIPILAFLVAPLILWTFPLLSWSVCMWTHEFGHAFGAWFGGIAATPFFGWTSMALHRSWTVTLCFTVLLVLLGYKSWEKKSIFLIVVLSCMFVAQMYFRFFLDDDELTCMTIFMGIAGEFWISALLVIAFHYRLPAGMHWQGLRYFVLFAAAFTFYHNFNLWLGVSHGTQEIPWGSLWGGHGDMNILRDGLALE